MASQSSGSESSKKNRSLREFLDENNGRPPPSHAAASGKGDSWSEEPKQEDLDATSDQEHEEILRRLRSQNAGIVRPVRSGGDEGPRETRPKRGSEAVTPREQPKVAAGSDDIEKLLADNEQLRNINAELKQCLEESPAQKKGEGDTGWEEREKEYEALLEEKSEKIRELFVKIQELEKEMAAGGGGKGGAASKGEGSPDNEELLALSDELERERCQLEQERRQMEEDRKQLHDDEESMMKQMREMELQMAKERAELARKQSELQRLHAEIRHELELAQRDAAVNERLRLLQRRHQEVSGDVPPEGPKKKTPAPGKAEPKKESGATSIMKRFFGGGK
jgi:hypothetical protein